jgi:hypothetical protein
MDSIPMRRLHKCYTACRLYNAEMAWQSRDAKITISNLKTLAYQVVGTEIKALIGCGFILKV